MLDLEFVANQFQQFADLDPIHCFSDEGCVVFDGFPVYYQRWDDVFVLTVDNVQLEVPRYS